MRRKIGMGMLVVPAAITAENLIAFLGSAGAFVATVLWITVAAGLLIEESPDDLG